MTQPIDPALVARMCVVLRECASGEDAKRRLDGFVRSTHAEVLAIVAELPEPVDPDLLLAREIVSRDSLYSDINMNFLSGENDNSAPMRIALAVIKRVRQEAK